jgi:cytochrome c-type biogenesis protein
LEAARPKIIKPISFSWLHGRKGLAAGFVFGLLIIFIASPCVVPLLAAAAIFALTSESVLQRAGLLLAYSAGLGLPFIAIAAFFGSSKRLSEFSRKGIVHKVQLIVLAATIVWLLWLFLSF